MSKTDTRDRLIECGTKAIVAKSYNGVGLQEILCSAGVPKGSFYHYFKSKEDFGVSIVETAADEHAQWMREILTDRTKSPLARIQHFFDEMRQHHVECGPDRECLIAKLALEVSQLSEPMRAAIKYAYDHVSSILAQAIREAQAAGELRRELDPDGLAGFLVNAWEGVTIRMQIDRNLAPIDNFLELAFKTLLKPSE